jgi:hypothetical protein
MRHEIVKADVTVVGGGLAGVCAAVAAARLGRRVSLVQNRPVLGGVSSSEIRVWVGGANGLTHNRHARETGIVGEMLVENQYRNPEGNPYIWDLVVLEKVKAEPNITLFLNTDVRELEASGPQDHRTIASCTGWMMGAERSIRFESPLFLDCTGDALIGLLSGAQFRSGREARSEFNEIWAPEVADEITLGSTILFHTKDTGKPVEFIRPSFARDITETTIPIHRILSTGDSGAKYWWIEFGGGQDTIHEDAAIRDELWSAVYGIWDYIKNSGKFDAANLTLEWVGSIPGKRESRRLVGDYMITQNDVIAQRRFDDRVAFGGWMVDLHPIKGMYDERGAAQNMYGNGVFHIPFRCLYSVNVDNLLFAGRNISASHVGFGATRVMATCAAMGEAVGTAAAICLQNDWAPRTLGSDHIGTLQRHLLKQDAPLVGLRNDDPSDLARGARVSASSWRRHMKVEEAERSEPLARDLAFVLPVNPCLDGVELLISAEKQAVLQVELWSVEREENYVPHQKVTQAVIDVGAGKQQWVYVSLPWQPAAPANACIIVRAVHGVSLHTAAHGETGTLAYTHRPERRPNQFHTDGTDEYPPLVLEWDMKDLLRRPLCFRALPETEAFVPENVVNGLARPFGGPNLWASAPLAAEPQGEAWLELAWERPQEVKEVLLTFNDDLNEHLNNLHKFETPFRVFRELVRNYRVEAMVQGQWTLLAKEAGNRVRRRIHRFTEHVTCTAIRLVVEATNGAPQAEVFEIRVY